MRLTLCVTVFVLSTSAAVAGESSVTLAVENMTCAACPVTVKTAIARVRGVKDVEVDMATNTAAVVFDDQLATVEQFEEASRLAGFPAHRED